MALLAGAFAVPSVAPYDFFAVCFVAFPILVWLLDGTEVEPRTGLIRRAIPAFAIGWWFGFGYFAAGLWWVGTAMLVEAENYAWALPFAVVILPAILALFYGLATAIARLFWTDDVGRIAALAVAFASAEWLRTFVFTGFPWNPVGMAAMPVPLLMQSVSVIGMNGMNALAVFVFAAPALLAGQRHVKLGLGLAALLMAMHVSFGYYQLTKKAGADGPVLSVRIVQPSIDQALKWDGSVRDRIFGELIALSQAPVAEGQAKPALILWPETAVPFLFTERPDALAALSHLLGEDQLLVAGVVRAEGGSGGAAARYYNSVMAIDGGGVIVDAVDKVHLVPGGEYLPLAELFEALGVERLVPIPNTFSAGGPRRLISLPLAVRAAAFVCYEIIFSELVAADSTGADVIVNVTNDGWFGNTPGPYQHLRQAQVRAVENGLPLLRAANTGISAAIDSHGRILDALSINARGTLDLQFPLSANNTVFLAGRSLNGLAVVLFLTLVFIGMNVRQRLRLD